MDDILKGDSSQIFDSLSKEMIESEILSLDRDRMEEASQEFDIARFRDKMANEVGKSLGVTPQFWESQEGQETLYDIASFLEREQQVSQLEQVSHALVTLLNSIVVPQQDRHPDGWAKKLKEFLLAKKGHKQVLEEIEDNGRIWKPRPQ